MQTEGRRSYQRSQKVPRNTSAAVNQPLSAKQFDHPLSAVQIEYSLWTRDVEAEILPLCEEPGIGFVAYSPLGLGFLTGKVGDIAELRAGDARRNMPRFQGDNLRRNLTLVEELKAHAAAENCTPAQLAFAWVLTRVPHIVPIPGTSHPHRPEENAAAAALKISAETEDALLQGLCHGNANEHASRAKLAKRHAAATAPCHCAVASDRKIRSVDREMRWRCRLKVL